MFKLLKFLMRVVLHILLWMSIPMLSVAENAYSNYPQATVSSDKKLNIRSGPGKDFNVIGQLIPAEIVYVTGIDNASSNWTEICTQAGTKGYVSQSYLVGNYIAEFENMSKKETHYIDREEPFLIQWYLSFYLYLFSIDATLALLLLLSIGLIEICFIIWLKRKYKHQLTASPLTAYIVLVISALLTFPSVAVYNSAIQRGAWGITVFVLMLLCTSCLMLHAAWRIKLCGMSFGKRRNGKIYNYQIGRWLGNILWLVLLIPFTKIWWRACDVNGNDVYYTKESFGSMLFVLFCMAVINLVVATLVWPRVIVRYLFHIANQGVVHIMSFVLFCGIASYEYNVIYYNFDGINFIFALCLYILLLISTFGLAWSTITKCRCANCHSYSTAQTGVTYLGNTYRTTKGWKDIDGDYVNRRVNDSIVTDAKKLVATTEVVSQWKTHHSCFNCSNSWDMDHEMTIDKSSRTLKKEWTEYR